MVDVTTLFFIPLSNLSIVDVYIRLFVGQHSGLRLAWMALGYRWEIAGVSDFCASHLLAAGDYTPGRSFLSILA